MRRLEIVEVIRLTSQQGIRRSEDARRDHR